MFGQQTKFTPHITIEKVTNGFVVTIIRSQQSPLSPMIEAVKEMQKTEGDEWKNELHEERQVPMIERLVFRNYAAMEAFIKRETVTVFQNNPNGQ